LGENQGTPRVKYDHYMPVEKRLAAKVTVNGKSTYNETNTKKDTSFRSARAI